MISYIILSYVVGFLILTIGYKFFEEHELVGVVGLYCLFTPIMLPAMLVVGLGLGLWKGMLVLAKTINEKVEITWKSKS
jgi:predicted ABC-type sugar transport system permease subunit